jgi:DNA modification methylase
MMLDVIYNCDCLEGMKKMPSGSVDYATALRRIKEWIS